MSDLCNLHSLSLHKFLRKTSLVNSTVRSDNVKAMQVIPASQTAISAVQVRRDRSQSRAGLQSTVHAMSDLWTAPKAGGSGH